LLLTRLILAPSPRLWQERRCANLDTPLLVSLSNHEQPLGTIPT
jgi:hypothetical protein